MNAPIGIFDSGIGGLTVAHAIAQRLPNESLIYFGDTAHLPYGDKSAEAIQQYSLNIIEFLLQRHCKLIVIACNTASAVAFRLLKNQLSDKTPIINVIEPVVRTVVAAQLQRVGVIATKRTIITGIYPAALNYLQPDLKVVAKPTHTLVTLIEEGLYRNSNIMDALIEHYLSDSDFDEVEGLILGCTHYPIIKTDIERFFAKHRTDRPVPHIFDFDGKRCLSRRTPIARAQPLAHRLHRSHPPLLRLRLHAGF